MKILCWNVNGLRAVQKKNLFNQIFKDSPDIVCLQEIKALPEQLSEEARSPKGYFSYFNAPDLKKGYSGVAMYTKEEPLKVEYGMNGKDEEGRIIVAHFKDFALINVYFPNGGGGPVRLAYKLKFYDEFLKFAEKLRKEKPIVFCGDVNTAHKEIDLARPKENEKNTGFLPEERAWLDKVVGAGYVDVYRHFNPDKAGVYTYWDMKTYARDRNVGWRIDYFFVTPDIISKVKNIEILSLFMGSDHCPLTLELDLS
jgi:exodeoxyribonuclease III